VSLDRAKEMRRLARAHRLAGNPAWADACERRAAGAERLAVGMASVRERGGAPERERGRELCPRPLRSVC